MDNKITTFFTDGSCLANGTKDACGGYGVVGINERGEIVFARAKRSENTTNNREELKAILYVMFNYGSMDEKNIPIVYSDSAYCVNTFTSWMFSWQKKGWVKSDKKTPENLDLIKAYYDWYQRGYRIDLRKVKGHAGDVLNEIADGLATGRIAEEEVLNGNF